MNTAPYVNYSAPVPGQAANTTKITYLSPVGISGATKWQVKVQAGAFTPPPPDLDSTVAVAEDYVVNADIPVAAGQDHLLLLATDDTGKVKAYADINITGLISQPAATLAGGGVNYSDPVPGSAIGTTKIITLNLGATGAAKWQYKVLSGAFIPALSSTLAGAVDYTAGNNIPIAANQHLILLATDNAGVIIAYADITVPAAQIEPAAAALALGTDYSTPVPGLTPGTTRIVTLNLGAIAGATKWQYKAQAGAFTTPPKNSTLAGAADYPVNTDIAITAGQHLMLLATDAGGQILAYADLTINSGQINGNNMLLSMPTNYSTPVPGSAAGTTQIATLDFSGILGATKWQYTKLAGAFAAPAYDSTLPGVVLDYTAGSDITITAGQHLILATTDAAGKIKAYADITIAASYLRSSALVAGVGAGTNYSTPVAGGAGGNTKITTLTLPAGATKWQYAVQTGPFTVPGVDTTLAGATDYTAGADIPITDGQHLMLLATDADGKIKAFADMIVTVAALQINTNTAAAVLATPANYSVPAAGTTTGSTQVANMNLTGIAGATKWQYAVQAGPLTAPALNSNSALIVGTIAGPADYAAGTDIPVMSGQHLILLATDNGDSIKAYVDITLTAGQIRAYTLPGGNYSLPVPGASGGTTKISTLTLPVNIGLVDIGATKWQYAVQAGDAAPVLDSTLTGAADYVANTDITAAVGQHLVVLATDNTGKIKAFTNITLLSSHIRAYGLSSPANYSTPVPGATAGTTKIATLSLSGITGATKWRYSVQAGAFSPTALDTLAAAADYAAAGTDITVTAGQHLILLATDNGNLVKAYTDITIAANQVKSAASLITNFTTEAEVVAGNKTITIDLTLSGSAWASDIATSQSKKNLLFDNMTASGSESAEWAKVIGNLKTATNPVSLVGNVLTITLPPTANYNITSDQTITVKIPSSLLQITPTVALTSLTFTIKTDSNVTITGTITSSATAADVRKGGKTIIVTLKNVPNNAGGYDTWNANIALDTTKRQTLFSALTATGAEAAKWNTDVIDALKASATITRTSDTVVTIILPPVPTYNITGSQTIQLNSIPATCLTNPYHGNAFTPSSAPVFTITPAGATAAITGTVMGSSASPMSEANIVAGGNTIVYTLTSDTWAYDIATNSSKYSVLFGSLALTSPTTDENGMCAAVISALNAGSIARTSDTVVTITLPAVPAYHITAAQTITPSIPSSLVNSGVSPTVASTFTINPVTAAVSGTAVSTATTQDNIVSGSKTIIVTLNNSTWATDVVTNSTKVNLIIDGITASPDDATWQKVRTALKANTSKIRVAGAVLTITMPAVSDYSIAADQTVTVNIDKSLLKQPTAVNIITPSFTVFAVAPPPATATVTFSPTLDVTNIRNHTASLVITINNDTWVGDIATNKNKLNTLIDGFTTTTDVDQWGLVKTAVKNPSTSIASVLSQTANNQITITPPSVGSYNVTADQVISIKIPKALLNLAKADLTATPSLTVKALVKGTLSAMLQDGSLDTLLATYSPNNIYVVVPKKYINKINMSNNTLGSTTYTDLDVQAENEVNAVQAASGGVVRTSTTYTVTGGKRIFSLAFPGLATDTDVIVSAFSDTLCTTKLGKDITVKVAAGNTIPYPPKGAASASLAGSYSLQKLISDSKTFNSILLQYGLDELSVIEPN